MEDPNQTYRMLHFLVKHGDRFAALITFGIPLLGAVVSVWAGLIWTLPVWVLVGGFLYVIMRSYVELVRVIVDMLLPK